LAIDGFQRQLVERDRHAHYPGRIRDATQPGTDRSGDGGAARHGGEWRVEKQRLRWDIREAFAQAAQQAGIAHTDDFNGGDNAGGGAFEAPCRIRRRLRNLPRRCHLRLRVRH
jgi:choline dehydrogenase-like flavoprotein